MTRFIVKIFILTSLVACGGAGSFKTMRPPFIELESAADQLPQDVNYNIVASIDRNSSNDYGILKSVDSARENINKFGSDVVSLCQNGVKKTKTQKILVPKTASCEYGKGANLEKKESSFQAMIKQKAKVELPTSAAICEVSLRTDDNLIKYNDHFAVTYSDILLFSSFNMAEELDGFSGIYLFNWNNIRGKEIVEHSSYCIGVCRYPVANRLGSLKADFNVLDTPGIARFLVTPSGDSFKGEIGIYVTGDKDDDDCSHNDVVVTVDVRYIDLQE